MGKYIYSFSILFLSFTLSAQDLIITGVIDGPLTGSEPKAIELYATADIADLSLYAIGSANNGGGTDGAEFSLSGSASNGDYIYISSDATQFDDFFGFAPTFTSGFAAISGDDAIELFFNGSEIDVFGEITHAGGSLAWGYDGGWAYRNDETGPDGTTFTISNWSFGDVSGSTTNADETTPFPLSTYSPTDITAPAFSSSFPYLDNVDPVSFDIFGQLDEQGTIYYVVVSNDAVAPSSSEVVNGTAPGGIISSGSIVVNTALSPVSINVSGLTDVLMYDVYVVAQDDEGTPNVQSSPTKLDYSPDFVAITEFINDPAGTDSDFEWIELYNYGANDVDLTNWRISDEGSDDDPIGSITIIAGDYVILARDKINFETRWLGSSDSRVIELSGISLTNTDDEIILSDDEGVVIWSLAYVDDESTGLATYLAFDAISTPIVYTGIDRDDLDGTGTVGYEDAGDGSAVTAGGDTGSPLDGGYTQPLPVELISLTGKEEGRSSVLSWTTMTETNNAGFQIEKSLDGVSFQSIGFVDGNGNSNELIEYSFLDYSFLQTSYYRLNQVDFDGKSELSPTIRIVNSNETRFVIYPNPFSTKVRLDFSAENFHLLVYNLTGKKVVEEDVTIQQASDLLENLLEGTYQVHTYNMHFNASQKLVKR